MRSLRPTALTFFKRISGFARPAAARGSAVNEQQQIREYVHLARHLAEVRRTNDIAPEEAERMRRAGEGYGRRLRQETE